MAYTDARRPQSVRLPVVANVAIGTNADFGGFIAPFPGEMISAQWENGATVAANATDYNLFTVNKSVNANMSGSVVMATLNGSGTGVTANQPVNMTLNTTVASVRVNAGDHIHVWKNAVLNGTAHPANLNGGATLFFIWDQLDHTNG